MDRVGPREVQRILAVTDALHIHRESVAVPLAARGEGSLRVTPAGRLEIVAPADTDFDTWLQALPARVAGLDLSSLRRTE
jgi:hypothetical protein